MLNLLCNTASIIIRFIELSCHYLVLTGASDDSHPARINVTGPSGETLRKDIDVTTADQPMLFYFYPEVIPNGQHFEACVTLLDTNKKIVSRE